MSEENQNQEIELEAKYLPEEALDNASEVAEGKKQTLPAVVIGLVVALLVACLFIACLAVGITALTGDKDGADTETAPPPAGVYIQIEEPTQGATLDISKPVTIRGSGAGLPEGNVVVQAIDREGTVLAEKPTTLQGQDVGSGGSGTWEVELSIETEPGMAGMIYAFSLSPLDNSMVAWAEVRVSLGRTEAKKTYIQIEEPRQGEVLDISRPVTVKGRGGALPEGNVVVQVLDRDGNVLAERPTTVQAPDAGAGGEGPWSVELTIDAEPGMAGTVYAFARSPLDNSLVAQDSVEVSLGRTEAKPTFLEISEPAEGAVLDAGNPIQVSGTGGGLPEGNVVVVALDANDNVLAKQATILQGDDVSSGGAGTWSVQLIVGAVPGATGRIVAVSPSPTDGSYVASAVVNVTYGGSEGGELEGPQWLLSQTLPGAEVTALFQNGQVSGSAGCNSYQGSYTTSTSLGRNTIQVGPLASTMMMCPEQVMNQEQAYLTALQSATTYQVEGNILTLDYSGGALVFQGQIKP